MDTNLFALGLKAGVCLVNRYQPTVVAGALRRELAPFHGVAIPTQARFSYHVTSLNP